MSKELIYLKISQKNKESKIEEEIQYLRSVFTKVNNYPVKVVENTTTKVRNDVHTLNTESESESGIESDIFRPHLSLPYGGDKGNTILKKFKRLLSNLLPTNMQPEISVKGKKIASRFNIKDKVDDKHTSGFVYEFKCNRAKCDSTYIGETGRRREVRVREHGETDESSAILQHCRHKKHAKAKDKNFKILAGNYPHWRRRKLCESMYIRDKKPDLNKQGDKHRQSYKLPLFN